MEHKVMNSEMDEEKFLVLLYNGRIDKMWDISGHKINILASSNQYIVKTLPTYIMVPYFPHYYSIYDQHIIHSPHAQVGKVMVVC